MKPTIIIVILALTSCQKDWKCDVETSTGLHTTIDFRGTKTEMQEYEQEGTYSAGEIDVVTNCY